MRYILFILAAIVCVGCDKTALKTDSTNNKDIQVEFLFEYEGCRNYRFNDGGHIIHYTNCTATSKHVSCGKGCIKEETVNTTHE